MENNLRWFAVVYERAKIGYAIDYYPNEKRVYERAYEREPGGVIIGDFATREQAHAAVRRKLLFSHDQMT